VQSDSGLQGVYNQSIILDELTTIGWGSHETQFKGSNCKKIPELDIDRMATKSISEHDDRRITVTWRADAQFFGSVLFLLNYSYVICIPFIF
jgi:hypothetical protein